MSKKCGHLIASLEPHVHLVVPPLDSSKVGRLLTLKKKALSWPSSSENVQHRMNKREVHKSRIKKYGAQGKAQFEMVARYGVDGAGTRGGSHVFWAPPWGVCGMGTLAPHSQNREKE